jgi:hypothetical protein
VKISTIWQYLRKILCTDINNIGQIIPDTHSLKIFIETSVPGKGKGSGIRVKYNNSNVLLYTLLFEIKEKQMRAGIENIPKPKEDPATAIEE